MSADTNNSSGLDKEIDLRAVVSYLNSLLNKLIKFFLESIIFYYNYKLLLLVIILAGFSLGFYIDKNNDETYKSNFIVSANYDSANYLYNKAELFETKIKQKDSVFLKDIFGINYKLVSSIEIEPIVDLYNFIGTRETNSELFELLSENENLKEFILEPVNSRNYQFHKIDLYIDGLTEHEDLSNAFFKYLNSNKFYNNLKNLSLKNYEKLLIENDSTVKQIDNLIASITNSSSNTQGLVLSVSEKPGLDDLLERKKNLINEERYLNNNLLNKNKIISIVDSNFALDYDKNFFDKSRKFILPIFLVILFTLFFIVKYFIRKGKLFLDKENTQD